MRRFIQALVFVIASTTAMQSHADAGGNSVFSSFTRSTDQYLAHARNLVLHAMGFMGVNYKYGGSTPETGFDCSGLVQYVFNQALGLVLPRDTHSISQTGREIAREELQPGDLVFFNTLHRPFSHVGIYLGEQRFIHSPSSGGQVAIVNMSDRYWIQRYNGARRISM